MQTLFGSRRITNGSILTVAKLILFIPSPLMLTRVITSLQTMFASRNSPSVTIKPVKAHLHPAAIGHTATLVWDAESFANSLTWIEHTGFVFRRPKKWALVSKPCTQHKEATWCGAQQLISMHGSTGGFERHLTVARRTSWQHTDKGRTDWRIGRKASRLRRTGLLSQMLEAAESNVKAGFRQTGSPRRCSLLGLEEAIQPWG